MLPPSLPPSRARSADGLFGGSGPTATPDAAARAYRAADALLAPTPRGTPEVIDVPFEEIRPVARAVSSRTLLALLNVALLMILVGLAGYLLGSRPAQLSFTPPPAPTSAVADTAEPAPAPRNETAPAPAAATP